MNLVLVRKHFALGEPGILGAILFQLHKYPINNKQLFLYWKKMQRGIFARLGSEVARARIRCVEASMIRFAIFASAEIDV